MGHKLTDSEIQTFHDFKYFKEKFDYLSSLGTSVEFVKTDNEIPENMSEKWIEDYQKICDKVHFPMEILVRSIYVDKKDAEMNEVRDVQKHLIPCRANAFLFSKRNHD